MNDPNNIRNVHTPVFDIDEAAIETGIGMMAWLGASVENGSKLYQKISRHIKKKMKVLLLFNDGLWL